MKKTLLLLLSFLVLTGCQAQEVVNEAGTECSLEHSITSEGYSKTVNDSRGRECYIVRCDYPVIENVDNNAYIDYINELYADKANVFYEAGLEVANAAVDLAETLEEMPAMFPWEEESFFKVVRDKGGYLSIAEATYHQMGGAHPTSYQYAKTFDLNNEKELMLSDVLKGTSDEISEMIYTAFVEKYGEEYFYLNIEGLKNAADTVSWYITDKSIVLYYNIYEVTPYAAGMPTVEIAYNGNEDIFKISLE